MDRELADCLLYLVAYERDLRIRDCEAGLLMSEYTRNLNRLISHMTLRMAADAQLPAASTETRTDEMITEDEELE